MDSHEVITNPNTAMASPTYAAAFRCIGTDCEDTCCGDWDIPIDKNTYGKYQQFPREKLGSLVSQFVLVSVPDQPDPLHARIYRGPSGFCAFFGSDSLCSIHKEYGPQLLSATCSIYPRSFSYVAGALEGSLSLSCPEAARNILLVPRFMQIEGDLFSGNFRTDNVFHLADSRKGSFHKPHNFFLTIRTLLVDMVRDRSCPLWHRLLLIGSLCESLDNITTAEGEEAFPTVLREYRQIVEHQISKPELVNLPSLPRLRLEVVFRLTDALVRDNSGKRFRDTFWAFVEGIASPDSSAPQEDIERFLQAEAKYYRPFFEKFPFILENYLVNYMFQNLFPYGREGSPRFIPRSLFGEYIQMTTQFAWVNTLLIGVAGHYKEDFAEEHVVQTIQSFTRAVEHYPEVLQSIDESMRSLGLNNLQGMAVMLKI
jgi:lysine-N-methylase